MFYGFTESESFDDPTLLNRYQHHKVVIEKRTDGKGFWHIFILSIKDIDIEKAIIDISKTIKADWNAMFYNKDIVYAVFRDKIFSLKRKRIWRLSDYVEVKKHSFDCGVGILDMNEVFKHYKTLLGKR